MQPSAPLKPHGRARLPEAPPARLLASRKLGRTGRPIVLRPLAPAPFSFASPSARIQGVGRRRTPCNCGLPGRRSCRGPSAGRAAPGSAAARGRAAAPENGCAPPGSPPPAPCSGAAPPAHSKRTHVSSACHSDAGAGVGERPMHDEAFAVQVQTGIQAEATCHVISIAEGHHLPHNQG